MLESRKEAQKSDHQRTLCLILGIALLARCGLIVIESEAKILMVCDVPPHDVVNNDDEQEMSQSVDLKNPYSDFKHICLTIN